MFTRTPWRIRTWNGASLGVTIVIGLSAGALMIGLEDTSSGTEHNITAIGLGASGGFGVDIHGVSIPSGLVGYSAADLIHSGGTIYKNDNIVPGDLTFSHLRDATVLVRGLEISDFSVGESGYCVHFISPGRTVGHLASGILQEPVAWFGCNAFTFLSVGSPGLPNAAIAGYRYIVQADLSR